MNRILSLSLVLLVLAFGSLGLMYMVDYVPTVKYDRLGAAVLDVIAWSDAQKAINNDTDGIPLFMVLRRIKTYEAIRDLPVLVMTTDDVTAHPGAIHLVPGRGMEAIVIVTDIEDPRRAIRRAWISDASLAARYSVSEASADTPVFAIPDAVEGGSPLEYTN